MSEQKPKSNLSLYEKTKVVAEGKQIFDKVQTDSAHIHLRLNCQDSKIEDVAKKHKDLASVLDNVSFSLSELHKKVGDVEKTELKFTEAFVSPENLETYDANLRIALDEDFAAVKSDIMDLRAQIQVLYNKFEEFERGGVKEVEEEKPLEPQVVPEKEPVKESVREADADLNVVKVVEKPKVVVPSRGTLYKTTINTSAK